MTEKDIGDEQLDVMLASAIRKQNKINQSVMKSERMLTFREMREKQRLAESARVGPGSIDYTKPFGSDVTMKVFFGSKYGFKPDLNPAPGQYETASGVKMTKPRAREAYIAPEERRERPEELGPEPGTYDGHLKPFAADIKTNITFGEKYKFKPDSNPAPGQYNADRAVSLTQRRAPAVTIREDSKRYTRPKEDAPAPGQYDKHLTPFAADVKTNITFGSKYQFKPDSNPAPGSYDVESSYRMVKARSPDVRIREPLIAEKRQKERGPDPGQYDAHLTPFGANITNKAIFGSKYEFKPDKNPPPGLYNPEAGEALTKRRVASAMIRNPVSPYRRP